MKPFFLSCCLLLLPAGQAPTRWRPAVGRDCGNRGVFPGGARLRMLLEDLAGALDACEQDLRTWVPMPLES